MELLIGSALAAEAATVRTPFSYDAITYLWVLVVSGVGGFVHFVQKVRQGEARAFNFTEFVGELVTSGFVGVLTFWICEWGGVNQMLSAVFIGITGHMGSRAMFIAEKVAQRWLEGKAGVITTDTAMPAGRPGAHPSSAPLPPAEGEGTQK